MRHIKKFNEEIEISNILRYGVPKYDPNDKYQYRNIVSILKSIYKLSYNDGN